MAVDVRLAGLYAYVLHQVIDDLFILLQLQPPGVVYRQWDALLRELAGLFRHRLPLTRRGKAPLEDLVDQRALADPRAAGDENVHGPDLMGGFADAAFDHAQDVFRVFEAVQ